MHEEKKERQKETRIICSEKTYNYHRGTQDNKGVATEAHATIYMGDLEGFKTDGGHARM